MAKLSSALVFIVAAILATPSFADVDRAGRGFVVIQKVFVDSDRNELNIIGKHFDSGRVVEVFLADEQLLVLSSDGHLVVAYLPDSIQPGDYLLTVRTGRGMRRFDRFALTIPNASMTAPSDPTWEVIVVRKQYSMALGANAVTGLSADCPDGTVVTGGGVRQFSFRSTRPPTGPFDYFVGSSPWTSSGGKPTKWIGSFFNTTSSPVPLNGVEVTALCASF